MARKEGGRELPSTEDSVDESIWGSEDYIKQRKETGKAT